MKAFRFFFLCLGLGVMLAGCTPPDNPGKTWLVLDTTYYPFAAGYKWVYEEYTLNYQDGQMLDSTYEMYKVEVTDSAGSDSSWTFKLEGYFEDLPQTVAIEADSVYASLQGYPGKPGKTISIVEPQTDTLTDLYNIFSISKLGDTLNLKIRYATGTQGEHRSISVDRLKGFGVVSQEFVNVLPPDSQYIFDRTLFLIKENDTIRP